MEPLPTYRRAADVPKLELSFPRPIRCLHQIEVTSRCDLRCPYCPSPNLARPKVDISPLNFERALDHVRCYVAAGTQDHLNLAGIGESTLHPLFIDFLPLARAATGPECFIGFASNGLNISTPAGDALLEVARVERIAIWISLHRPERAGIAVEKCRRAGVLAGVSHDPATNADDWAGQVKWHRSQPYVTPCMWLRDGKAMALADGRVTACCLDASGAGVLGHVEQPVGSLASRPFSLCGGCAQEVAVKGYEQRGRA